MSANPRVTLFLMTEKGHLVLKETAHKFGALFGLVVVGSDKAVKDDFEAEIIDVCVKHSLPYVRRRDFKRPIETEYAIAVSWRWLIDHPTDRLIVFHDSLLPRYRGFAPLVSSLVNREPKIGVTAIFGATGFDTGDILAQSATDIQYPIKIKDAISIVGRNYIETAESILSKLQNGTELKGTPQRHEDATYSVWLDELDYKIDWSKPANDICRFIDSVGYPYKGAFTCLDGAVIRVRGAEIVNDVVIENRGIGKTLFVEDGKPTIICGKGLLKITDACFEAGNADFLPVTKFRMRFT